MSKGGESMKEGWKMVKLGEVCDICLGLTHTPKYVDKGIPFISVKDISQGELNLNNTKRISEDEFTNMPDGAKPRKGDVLFCRVGTIGKPQVLKLDEPFGIFVSVGFLRTKTNSLNTYLRHWMDSNLFMSQVEKNVQGSTLKNLNTGWLKNFTLPLPPLEEQHRIVSILDASFEKIDALKKNAEENLKNAKALFQQVLAQELQPKEGWETKRLDEITTFYNGKAHEQCIDENGEYILVNSKYISSDTKIGKRTSNQLFPLYKDDIVMVMSDVPNGKALAKCLIIPTNGTHSLNQRICAFRNSKINVRLLYYLINRNPYLLSFNNGENQTNLRKNDILKMQLSYPTNEAEVIYVLKRLDEQIYLINALIENKEKTICECDALKQSILRQAFSGEL